MRFGFPGPTLTPAAMPIEVGDALCGLDRLIKLLLALLQMCSMRCAPCRRVPCMCAPCRHVPCMCVPCICALCRCALMQVSSMQMCSMQAYSMHVPCRYGQFPISLGTGRGRTFSGQMPWG